MNDNKVTSGHFQFPLRLVAETDEVTGLRNITVFIGTMVVDGWSGRSSMEESMHSSLWNKWVAIRTEILVNTRRD